MGRWEEKKGYRILQIITKIVLNYPYGFAIPVFRIDLECNESVEVGRDGNLPHLKV